MTLKLKVGKKGYIILPKALREAVGIEEGDDLTVSLSDAIILTPAKKFDRAAFEKMAKQHKESILSVKGAKYPEPGEAKEYSLEDEF
ncbi:MAG: AbrB/MazE/SpoVT family DNA-binding domain-containing protein [Candidatus Thermoplasmatota archaeon]|nr:AbrB/MazE/SpoVT family DNA-binding domain-containing protein [Candidatus Thermoplasmatota archaeon]